MFKWVLNKNIAFCVLIKKQEFIDIANGILNLFPNWLKNNVHPTFNRKFYRYCFNHFNHNDIIIPRMILPSIGKFEIQKVNSWEIRHADFLNKKLISSNKNTSCQISHWIHSAVWYQDNIKKQLIFSVTICFT